MKPIQERDMSVAANDGNTTSTRRRQTKDTVAMRFSAVSVSKWNRSFGATPDETYVSELAGDLRRNGLIHPLTLVASKGEGSTHAILAGANRYWALRKLRGEASGLMAGEYVVRADVTEEDPRCLDISLSENAHRRQPSVIETARYVHRLLQNEHVDQSKLAPKLHLRREVVNRLSKLVQCFDQLPESWRNALGRTPSQKDTDTPAITLSHWVEVAAQAGDSEVGHHLHGVLETAAKERWSTRDLRKALGKAAAADEGSASAEPAAVAKTGKCDISPLQMILKALELLGAAAEALSESQPDAAKRLQSAASAVQRVQRQIEAAEVRSSGTHENPSKAA